MRSCYNPENFKPYYPPTRAEKIPVAFETVRIPASLGDSTTYPPEQGAYVNKVVQYESDETVWLYDSCGNYTKVAEDLAHLVREVNGKTGVVILKTSDLENDSGYTTSSDVSTAIGVETAARELADSGLQSQIDTLVAASDVKDIVGTHAELEAYDTSKLGDNDIIKVLQDETQDDETTYYRWSASTEQFTLIGAEGPYYTKTAADLKFQDKLTAGSNITISGATISATDTTYSDFVGANDDDDGAAGLVPAPQAGEWDYVLKGNGLWEPMLPSATFFLWENNTMTNEDGDPVTSDDILAAQASGATYIIDDGEQKIVVNVEDGTGGTFVNTLSTNYNPADDPKFNVYFYGNNHWAKGTKNLQGKLTAGTNVSISGNTISATDTTYTHFTGATASTDGVQGLVPGPLAGDEDKFLSGDGTWKIAGSSTTAKVLTPADYNWNDTTETADNPNCVCLWMLDPGIYSFESGTTVYLNKISVGNYDTASVYGTYIVSKNHMYGALIIDVRYGNIVNTSQMFFAKGYVITINPSDPSIDGHLSSTYTFGEIVDNLTTNNRWCPLSAKQGKALKDLIDSKAIGTDETYTIADTDWTALSGSSPYTYSADVTATYTIGNDTIVELINDNPVAFSTYGFAVGAVNSQTVTIYSVGAPSSSVSLTINYKG